MKSSVADPMARFGVSNPAIPVRLRGGASPSRGTRLVQPAKMQTQTHGVTGDDDPSLKGYETPAATTKEGGLIIPSQRGSAQGTGLISREIAGSSPAPPIAPATGRVISSEVRLTQAPLSDQAASSIPRSIQVCSAFRDRWEWAMPEQEQGSGSPNFREAWGITPA